MKKAGIFTLTLILIMAMFSGCRGQNSDTTMTTGTTNTTNTTRATQTTTKATLPAPVVTSPSSTGATSMPLQPGGTDASSSSQMPRRQPGPRY